ncbi:hypothetical protein [Streptomyces virginiae]|uniref:hypothetical protein n=1 Tax=Streptomyces virginiae TaxID=1961 RepID=UPI002DB712C9|nr:hypothetical protein [Streptomyces sp. CMAA1738]MEC4572041.1 hypothetical protein [Streptomyces sp. CMAA1738]
MSASIRYRTDHDLGPCVRVLAESTSVTHAPRSDSGVSHVSGYEGLGRELLGTVEQEWSPTRTVSVHCYAAPRRG